MSTKLVHTHAYDRQLANLSPKNNATILKNPILIMEILLLSAGPGKTIAFKVFQKPKEGNLSKTASLKIPN